MLNSILILKSKKFNKIYTQIILILFFIIGIFSVKDYGISYDELEYRQQGFIVLNHIGKKIFPEKIAKIKEERNLDYPTFEKYFGEIKNNFKFQHTLYALVEYIFQKKELEKKNIYTLRHYLNFFVFFISVIYFYKVLRIFFSREESLIGMIFYFLMPRIFANSFYNPNDIFFLVLIIINFYYAMLYLVKGKTKYLFLMSIFTALAFNVRIIGIYIYLLFLAIYFIKNFYNLKNFNLKIILTQFFFTFFIIFLITPQLWDNPFYNFFDLFFGQLKYSAINPSILFANKIYEAKNLPWYYLITWILISTPLIVIILFLIGLIRIFSFSSLNFNFKKNLLIYFSFICLFCPLIANIIFKPNIYNGWRQFYFLWPFILIIAIFGINYFFKSKLKVRNFSLVILLLSMTYLGYWNVKYHPFQNVFYNSITKYLNFNFENDYWGLSNKKAFLNILEHDKKKLIIIKPLGGSRIDFATLMLNNNQKRRIKLVKFNDSKKADYYITTYNNGLPFEFYINKNYEEFNSIYISGKRINTVFKKKY